ncbi:MAG: hypothetical protein OHK005_12020 [Candidatus Methylacidiphilales bacterium]
MIFVSKLQVRFCAAVLVWVWLGAWVSTAGAQWETVRFNNSTWVTFKSFCEFYGFRSQRNIGEKGLEVSGSLGTLRFTRDSNEAWFNGGKVWMSFKLTEGSGGQLLLNQVDVAKLWEPLLRSSRVRGLRPPRGVVIDPGHGGSDRGARGLRRLVEKDVTLDTARRLDAILKQNRIATVLTRNSDTFVSLERRAALAGQYRDYIFVSLHYNWGPRHASGVETFSLTPQYAPSTSGPQTLRISDTQRESGNRFDEANLLLAHLIHEEQRKLHPARNDRGLKRARFAVLRLAQIPAVLVEGGFVSNSGDSALIADSKYRQRLAEAVARGVMNYFALTRGRATGPAPREADESQEDWTAEQKSAPGRTERTVVERSPPPVETPAAEVPAPAPARSQPSRTPTPPRQSAVASTTSSASRAAPSTTPPPPADSEPARVEEPAPAKPDSQPSRSTASVPVRTPPPERADSETPATAGKEPAPPPSAPTAVVTSYRIQPGDNLSKIARRYGVTVEQLKAWNGLSNDMIQAGKTLRVRAPDSMAKVTPPAEPAPSVPPTSQAEKAPAENSVPASETEGAKPPELGTLSDTPASPGPAIETVAPPVETPPPVTDSANAHES